MTNDDLTTIAQTIASARGAVLLRDVRFAHHLDSGFQVRRGEPTIFLGRSSSDIARTLVDAVSVALDLDIPDGQYLLHDGERLLPGVVEPIVRPRQPARREPL